MITVSGCLILTAANSSSYGWLSKCQFLQDVTVDISLHEVCVRVGVLYVITKFSRMDSSPNFLTHGAPLAYARTPLVITNLNNNCDFNSSYNIEIVTFIKQDKNCIC